MSNPAIARPREPDLGARKAEILESLDIAAEYAAMGVEFTKPAPNAKGWRECRAMGREDRTPSASVNLQTGIYRDHGGGGESLSFWDFAVKHGRLGDFGAVLRHYSEKAGVAAAGASPAPPPARRGFPTFDAAVAHEARRLKGTRQGHWIYPDPAAAEALRVVRFAVAGKKEKTYRPFHFDRQAGWVCADPPGLLPLYGRPALAEPGVLWLWEGEKVAELGRKLGLNSTTSAHGAGSSAKSDWSPLAGRDVVIGPDHDQAGEKYAAELLGRLAKLDPQPRVRVLRLPGLPEGGDLEQWLEALPDSWDDEMARAELERLADETAPEDLNTLQTVGSLDSLGGGKASKAIKHSKTTNSIEGLAAFDPEGLTDAQLGLTPMAEVEAEEVTWTWPDRIPRGKITLLAGEGGLGKTYLALAIAAIKSRGGCWPDRPGEPTPRGRVVILTAEDGLADTIRPRLDALGADVAQIDALGTATLPNGKLSPFTLADIDRLEAVMRRRPGVELIIIDPVTAFLGRGVDDHKNAELRALLGPISDFATKHRVAIVCITHFSKGGGKASAKIIGSVAYSNAARATWCVLADPEDENRRLLLAVKNNLSPLRSGLGYTIADGVLVWEDSPVTRSANDVLASQGAEPKQAKRDKAIAWLKEFMAGKPGNRLPSDDVIAAARAAGFGRSLIWDVKDEASIRARKGPDGRWSWVWEPPDDPAGASPPGEEFEEFSA